MWKSPLRTMKRFVFKLLVSANRGRSLAGIDPELMEYLFDLPSGATGGQGCLSGENLQRVLAGVGIGLCKNAHSARQRVAAEGTFFEDPLTDL